MSSQSAKVEAFHRLHDDGCFVMPNPWDLGSAVALEELGFPALATTSGGHAWALGRVDGQLPLDEELRHLREIAGGVDVPLNADFQGGFADDPADVATNVKLAAETGIAGLSIEDSTGDTDEPLYPFDLAVERIRAARRAIDESGTGVVLTGRSEGFFVGRPDLDETIRRLQAYADAGADCLYAPLITTPEQISAVVTAVAPKPVNLLVHVPFTTVAEAAGLGVRRMSVGGSLARVAFAAARAAAEEIAADGTFSRLGDG
jgi:2-methylisocitrate lyase-like PEP mutase family enzyme